MSSNITSLYVATSRLLFQPHIANPVSWAYEVGNLFPSLRDSLKCSVCQCLLVNPYSPKKLCQHHVCKTCLGKEKSLAQPCSTCENAEDHVENEELSLLLVCYNKLCSYIRQSSTLLQYLSECGGESDLLNIIVEGEAYLTPPAVVVEEPLPSSSSSYSNTYSFPTNTSDPSISSSSSSHHHKHRRSYQSNGSSSVMEEHPQPIYSVLVANEGNKITIKRKVPDEYSNISLVNNNRIRSNKTSKSGGCRCGLATAAPGKLTCCGQRCLCYTEQKPCKGCKCRGCRNPHTANGKKKLRGLEEYQLSLSQHQSSSSQEDLQEEEQPFIEEEGQPDTTIKIVGINSSNNNFQVIRYLDQETS